MSINPPFDIRAHKIWPSFVSRVAIDLMNRRQQLEIVSPTSQVMPPGFPNASFELLQALTWKEDGDWHPFQYSLRHNPPGAEYRSAKWEVHGKPRIEKVPHYRLGYVEIDALIYEPTEPLRDALTDGKVLLELLSKSVQSGNAIRLAFEVEQVIGAHNAVQYVESIVARYIQTGPRPLSSTLFHVFRRRIVPLRVCVDIGCMASLPMVGPDRCLHHIITPPGN
ncbi:hypothetical protein B0H11DRAFT_2003548 [Mycena galericulata]|nr:hypothetical protein B0H11DRAFT_2003548 [Mycena galericulata]